ncbi:MAG: DNA polymerase III subunit beta [Peptococcaceae bacterium]|nr:DNA polymerase III subunit beta [Peptococcaceae bacterium]
MKFIISKENLQYALQNVQRAISVRSPMPLLTGILFECSQGFLKLTATDMELSIISSVPVEMEKEGSIVIPAKYIIEFSKKLPDIPIQFEAIGEGKMVTIRYGQSEFNINGYSSDEYPRINIVEKGYGFSISSEKLKDIIRKIIYACSNDDSRPIFTGVLLEINGIEAAMVATDTFRLAIKKFKVENPSPEKLNYIIPGKALNEIVRIMGAKENINVFFCQNQAVFEAEDKMIITLMIPGKFPSYQQVIPEKFNCLIKTSIKQLMESADRASLLAGEKNSLIMFNAGHDSILINVRSESGWIREDVPAKVEGDSYEILFNVRYLWEAIKAHDEEEILIKLTGAYTPALLSAPEDDNYISIIVPARTRE